MRAMGTVDNELLKNSLVANGTDYWVRLSRDDVNLCSLLVVAPRMVFFNLFHHSFSICVTEETVLKR